MPSGTLAIASTPAANASARAPLGVGFGAYEFHGRPGGWGFDPAYGFHVGLVGGGLVGRLVLNCGWNRFPTAGGAGALGAKVC